MFRSISTKILTSQIGLVLLISVALGFFTYFLMVNSLIGAQQRNLTYIAEYHAAQLSSFINDKKRQFKEIAMGKAILAYSKKYEESALLQYFDSFIAEIPVLSYVNEKGFEEVTLVGGQRMEGRFDISETALFEAATWEPNKVFSLFSAPGGEEPAAAHMGFALCRKSFFDEFEGFIIGKIPLSDLVGNLGEFTPGETGFLMLIDDQGVVLYHPQKENILRKVAVKGKHSEQIISQIKAMKSDFGRATILGMDSYVAYSPVKGRNWAIIASLPYEEFMRVPSNLRNTVLTISLVVLALGLFISLATARGISKPIRSLTTASGLLARGNLSQRVDIRSRDEIGALGESFNRMAVGLQKTIGSRDKEIAERKQAEGALRESEERLDLAVKGANLGMWDWNVETGDVIYGERWVKMLGYELGELAPDISTWETLMHPEDKDRVMDVLNQHFVDDDFEYNAEFRFKTKSGDWKWINSRGRVFVRDEEKKPLRMVGTHIDITDRKQAEEEKKNLEAQLQQAHKMEAIGILAGGIAHDFNNILTAVLGFAELAQSDVPEGSQVNANLAEVLKAGKRARDLVKQMLTFSRQNELEQRPLQIGLIVKEALKLLRASIPTTIEIRQDITKESGLVLADPTQIHQVLMNLCTNAAYAMGENGGVLQVSLEDTYLDADAAAEYPDLNPGPYVRLSVSDTGPGIDQAIKEKIFNPFFTTKGPGEGTGMGLAVVHGIVEGHEGKITVENNPGRGATFHVLLPKHESKIQPEAEKIQAVLTGNERILFVDDEEPLVNMGQQMLSRLGYEVVGRTSSVEALEAFRAQPDKFDLVITDLTMPNMTGEQLARELTTIRDDIPVILCTGYSQMMSEEKLKSSGIDAFAMKPVVKKDMAETIRRVLDQQKGV